MRACRLCIAEAERLPGSSSAYFDAIFATTQERLTGYLAEHDVPDAAALAEDLLARTVLPRLFRTLLNVEAPSRDDPGEEVLSEAVDLPALRRLASAALRGG
ncbi:hypothetical protein BKA00_002937 [Actinomadura coerulea]|uniref:Transcriptional regulator TetR C-terminal Proteobacteria type domain-containing protein n=1 Tax=Actinomadura coerulea TaxID=46159 RepID=A0A7X0FYB9_9ACTN|nr:TetR/AcrR family transcriptional regulator C-terminal domain-containing protein [Actinomadura coerulea]MBB6396023.1 hypothetical protein [Actinomadura coerulea]GGQ41319.1 hypothetical protein GCM10010187_69320 [Actinomadura coerulea]